MKRVKLTWLIGLALVLPQVLIIASQIIFFQSSSSFIQISKENFDRHEIHYRTQNLLSLIRTAENYQRGYLLTAKDAYITDYNNTLDRIEANYQALAKETEGSSFMQVYMSDLIPLIREKVNLMNRSIESKQVLGPSKALGIEEVEKGNNMMSEIEQKIDNIISIQTEEMNQNTDWSKSHISTIRKIMLYASIVHFIFSFIIICLIFRIRQMEKMVTVCAWSKTINYEGKWMSFEEYLTKRFGISVTHGMSEQVFEEIQKTHTDKKLPQKNNQPV
jgi:CHASE3 domain sensor protein